MKGFVASPVIDMEEIGQRIKRLRKERKLKVLSLEKRMISLFLHF